MTAELRTRKPTGKPSWPIVLLAGAEKTGKTYGAALASKSPLVGRTWWVTIGEDQPDEYGLVGDFDIVEHSGKYGEILEALRTIAIQPPPAQGVPLLVVDSMTRLWDLLKDNAQATANKRRNKRPGDDAQVTADLWNVAAGQWAHIMDAIRAFPGPVILTARLDEVAVMDDKGQPTKEKQRKVQAHKTLVYDVAAVIEMPARGETWITGLRSVRYQLEARTRAAADFTVDGFWRQLGLADTATSRREHSGTRTDDAAAATGPVYDPAVAERWLPEIAGATYLGPKKTPDGDGLRAVMVRAGRAGVLEHLLFEPAEGEPVKTIGQYITERAAGMPEQPPAPAEDDVPEWASSAPIAEDELV